MRTKAILLAAMALLVGVGCSPSRTGDDSVVIDAKLSGYENADSVTVILFRNVGSIGKQMARTTLQDGRFRFVLDTLPEGSRQYMIMLMRRNGLQYQQLGNSSPLYLEPGAYVRIRGEAPHFRTARVSSPVRDQQLTQRFLRKMSRRDLNLFDDLALERDATRAQMDYGSDLSEAQVDSLRQRSRQLLTLMDSVSLRMAHRTLDLLETEEIGAYAMNRFRAYAEGLSYGQYKDRKDQMNRIVDRLSFDQKNSPEGQEILNFLSPIKAVNTGDAMPDYRFVDREGALHSFDELRGKPVLVDFWSNGCGPCIQSIPYLKQLYGEFGGRVAFVSICLDTDATWKDPTSAGARNEVPWNDWRDPKESAGNYRAYGTRGIPTFLVISPDGILDDVSAGFDMQRLRTHLNALQN